MNHATWTLMTAGLCAITAFLAYVDRRRASINFEFRKRSLGQAALAISTHADLLAEFLGDPQAPEPLRQILSNFSDLIYDRPLVYRLARAVLDSSEPTYDEETCRALEEVDALERANPDLCRKFNKALNCAFIGAMLRWPESAELFDAVQFRLATDPSRREVEAAVRASRSVGRSIKIPSLEQTAFA